MLVEGLPRKLSLAVIPYAFVLPAFGVLGVFLLYPRIQTIVYSFANDDSTAVGRLRQLHQPAHGPCVPKRHHQQRAVDLDRADRHGLSSGWSCAVLADKLSASGEKIGKSIIFLPMAISFVGASTIWAFIYSYKPEGEPQIGMLNAIWTWLGFDPVTWLQTERSTSTTCC